MSTNFNNRRPLLTLNNKCNLQDLEIRYIYDIAPKIVNYISCLLALFRSCAISAVSFSILGTEEPEGDRKSIHQDLNRGPLACLAETIFLLLYTREALIKLYRCQNSLYTVFFFWSHTTPIFLWPFFSSQTLFWPIFFQPIFFFGQIFVC